MYTACNSWRYTGRDVEEGVYREFYKFGRVASSTGHISVYSIYTENRMYTERIKGYTECGVEGMCSNFVCLVNNMNDPVF